MGGEMQPRDIEWYEYQYNLPSGAKVTVLREVVFFQGTKGKA